MSSKIYNTAQGRSIDLGQLQLQNETVRAVGNMGVNARGDRVDNKNTAIEQRAKMAAEHYARHVAPPLEGNVSDSVVPVSRRRGIIVANAKVEVEDLGTVAPDDTNNAGDDVQASLEQGGLAAAIARSRELKQQAEPTARQLKQQSGVTRI